MRNDGQAKVKHYFAHVGKIVNIYLDEQSIKSEEIDDEKE